MLNKSLFSSQSIDWFTPIPLYKKYDDKYHFTTDPCTTKENPLNCLVTFTKEDNGLNYYKWVGNVFINPPYGRKVSDWVKSAYEYNRFFHNVVVILLPARTDVKWFHEYIYKKENVEIEFLKGRVKFTNPSYPEPFPAPFPSMVVTFYNKL